MLMDDMIPYINLAEGLGRIRGNKALYVKMLGMFLGSKEVHMLEKSLLAAENPEEAADLAHTVKGLTGNLSLTALYETSNALMVALKAGKWDDTLTEQYRQALEKTLERTTELKQRLEAE